MAKVYYLLFALFLLPCAAARADCKYAGKRAWSKQLLYLVADCENRITSPDKQRTLRINAEGSLFLSYASGKPFNPVDYKVEPPGMASWAPYSDAFFVNDGRGSGLASTFRFFRIKNTQAIEDDSIGQTAVSRFRKKSACPSSAADPNVYGFGWSPDGKQVFLLVQATVNDSCGKQGMFFSLVVSVSDGSVIEQLTEKQTEKNFRSLLFPALFTK